MSTSGSRPIDFLISYRILKLLSTPFIKQDAYKYGIIDDKGNILKKYKTIKDTKEKRSYTYLHRFIFNLKRLLSKVGIRGPIGSFAAGLALFLKENPQWKQHKTLIESTIISYLKETKQYENFLNESREIVEIDDTPIMNCFGVDIYEINGQLVSEFDYGKHSI